MAEENGQPGEEPAPDTKADTNTGEGEETSTETTGSEDTNQDTDADQDEAKTTIEGDGDEVVVTAPGDWPEDWRDKMAGDDAEFRKRLDRFASPIEVAGWGKQAEKSWKQGADPEAFPTEGTDEEKTAWREKAGIPLEAARYHDSLPETLTIGDNDKVVYDKYFDFAHGKNLPPDVVNGFVELDLALREQALETQVEQDLLNRDNTTTLLREEYGPELKPHLLAGKALFDAAPEGLMDDIFAARMPNGVQLGSDPEAVKWLVRTALMVNPAATVSPGTDTQTSATNIDGELADLEKLMENTKSEYYTGATAEKHQARYRELVEAKNAMEAKGR